MRMKSLKKVDGSTPLVTGTRFAALAVAVGVLLAGCGSADLGGGNETPAETTADVAAAKTIADAHTEPPTTLNQDVPLSGDLPETGKFVYMNSGLPATTLMVDAAHEAIDAIGWEFQEISYEGANPATIRAGLLNALAQGANAVAISGDPVSSYGEDVLEKYRDAGVPLIVGSVCPLEPKEPIVQGAVGCEAEEVAAQALANWFIADSKGVGQAVFMNVSSIPSLLAYVTAFEKEVADKCPECTVKVVEATLDQVSGNQIVPSAVNTLRSNPDINYLFFDNAQFSKGIVAALKAVGLDKTVKVGGRSMDEGAQGALKEGTESVWTAFSYPVAGYSQVDTALRAITGSAGLDKTSALPFQLVTQQSVDGTSVPYNYPDGALEQYLELWGVK